MSFGTKIYKIQNVNAQFFIRISRSEQRETIGSRDPIRIENDVTEWVVEHSCHRHLEMLSPDAKFKSQLILHNRCETDTVQLEKVARELTKEAIDRINGIAIAI